MRRRSYTSRGLSTALEQFDATTPGLSSGDLRRVGGSGGRRGCAAIDGHDQAVAMVAAATISHDEWRVERHCEQRWWVAQHAGGWTRTGDPSDKLPAPATAPKTGRALPPAPCGSNQELTGQLLPFFVHRRLFRESDLPLLWSESERQPEGRNLNPFCRTGRVICPPGLGPPG